MQDDLKLNKPWLVAVWPGMGHVAVNAGYYLLAKLGMHLQAEFSAHELFDMEHVEVKQGLISSARLPRSRTFVWHHPHQGHDIILFIGEAQPPSGKYAFCHRLIDYAQQLGVECVFTFAAMATQMHPEHDSHVFGAATDKESLTELEGLDLKLLGDGHIGGLNGVLLGVAAEMGLKGVCLLGEMPHIFAQLPFPKASLAVVKIFTMISDIDIDTTELAEQSRAIDEKLGEILGNIEEAMEQHSRSEEQEPVGFEPPVDKQLNHDNEQLIENLFQQAQQDRSKAYELKRKLDHLGIFENYEDRFLDIFKKPE